MVTGGARAHRIQGNSRKPCLAREYFLLCFAVRRVFQKRFRGVLLKNLMTRFLILFLSASLTAGIKNSLVFDLPSQGQVRHQNTHGDRDAQLGNAAQSNDLPAHLYGSFEQGIEPHEFNSLHKRKRRSRLKLRKRPSMGFAQPVTEDTDLTHFDPIIDSTDQQAGFP